MKLSIFLAAQFEQESPAADGLAAVMQQVATAEQLGFQSVFLGHHYLARSQFLQPVSLAAYIAARTSAIRIGFGVHLLTLHNPLAMAEEVATLDVISGGRITFGVGTGYRRREYDAFGIPFDERFRRLDESVPLLRRLWRGETVEHDGAFGVLRDAQLLLRPVQVDGPPIWMGAFGERGIRRVAEHDACWLTSPEGTLDHLVERFALFRSELRSRGLSEARDYPLNREVSVAATRREAFDRVREYVEAQYRGYRAWDQVRDLSIDDVLADHALVGTPDEVIERLRSLHAALGITEVVARVQWMGMPNSDALNTIQLLGEHVIPEISHWG